MLWVSEETLNFELLKGVEAKDYIRTFEVGQNTFFIVIWSQTYEDQRVDCGGLNENNPHRLIYLNAVFSVGRTVWEMWPGWR